jgi:hypothetical protein
VVDTGSISQGCDNPTLRRPDLGERSTVEVIEGSIRCEMVIRNLDRSRQDHG